MFDINKQHKDRHTDRQPTQVNQVNVDPRTWLISMSLISDPTLLSFIPGTKNQSDLISFIHTYMYRESAGNKRVKEFERNRRTDTIPRKCI